MMIRNKHAFMQITTREKHTAHTARLSTRSAKHGVCLGVGADVLVDVLVDVMTGVSAGVLVVCIHKPPLRFSNGNSKKHERA